MTLPAALLAALAVSAAFAQPGAPASPPAGAGAALPGDRFDPPRDALAVAVEALAEGPGLFVGEAHEGNHPAYLFMLRHMGELYTNGVRVLGLEMVNHVDQDKVDAYYADPHRNAEPLKRVLRERWSGDDPYRFELIEKARSLGIATVAVDNRPDSDPASRDWTHAATNAFWAARVREAVARRPGSKFVVYGGFYHGVEGADRIPAIMGVKALLPADPNEFRGSYFGERSAWGVAVRRGSANFCVPVEGFADACRELARRDPATYGGLCELLAAGSLDARVAERAAAARSAAVARGPSYFEEAFHGALARRLERR